MCAYKHQNIGERISLARHFQNHSYEDNQYAVSDAPTSENESDLAAFFFQLPFPKTHSI
jgi:hypothetical protein